jgi:hypothetical protein
MLPEKGNVRHNFIMGVLNGAIFQFGVAFVDATTVLPVFIKTFTSSDFIVGLVSSVRRSGWYLPQLPMAGYLEQRPYKMKYYLGGNAIRLGLVWLFIPILARYGAEQPSVVLIAFLTIFTISSLAGGIAGSPFTDIVGKTIPRRFRGPFYAVRVFLGAGLLSVLAGLVVQHVLGEGGYSYPTNYVVIFTLFALFTTVGVACFGFVKEPPGEVSKTSRTFRVVLREVPGILRQDPNFRRLLTTQVLSSGLGFSLPFYIVLAREQFGVTAGTTGIFLAMQTVGATLFNLVWGGVSAKYGNRKVIRLTMFAQAIIPLYALVLGIGLREMVLASTDWVVTVSFAPIFLLIGGVLSGYQVGFNSFLLDVSPESRRPTYVGISNTAMGCAGLFPALGGLVADLVHLQGVFFVSAVAVCAAVITSGKLVEPREEETSL